MDMPDLTEPATPLSYTGDGKTLTKIMLRNLFLGFVTFGAAWLRGRVAVRHHVWQNIHLGGQPLMWQGTYEQQRQVRSPLGWALIFLALSSPIIMVAGLFMVPWAQDMSLLRHGHSLLGFLAAPLMQSMSYGYQLSRTQYQQTRLNYEGSTTGYAKVYLKNLLLSVMTLFFAYGAFAVHTRAYLINHIRWGNLRAQYTSDVNQACRMYVLGAAASLFTLGAYLPWHIARIRNHHANRTSLGPLRLRSTQDGSSLSNLWLGNFFIYVCTLGLGYGYAKTRSIRYQMAHLQVLGPIPSLHALPQPHAASGSGHDEGLVEFLSMRGDALFGA